MALSKIIQEYISGFESTLEAMAAWADPEPMDASISEELLKPIDCGSFEDDQRNLQGDFTRALHKVLSDDRS